MTALAESKRILITVRTYPTPAWKGVEVSCTAGVSDQGEWVRLFPVPYRRMEPSKRFKKYDWVSLEAKRAKGDTRPESYTPNIDSIRIVGSESSKNSWEERRKVVFPLRSHCLCCLERQRNTNGSPTLGLFRPRTIKRLLIQPDSEEWTPEQLARLHQFSFLDEAPPRDLEKIPFRFKYEFRCEDTDCGGHVLSCTDWEMCQAYRNWRWQYGENWRAKFLQKFAHEMIELNDTHFYVGTMHGHPATWIIVGLFYPRR